MYKLYHYFICPFSRCVRLLLNESGIEYVLIEHLFWDHDDKFLKINNTGTVPVLITEDKVILNHSSLIIDYIYTKYNIDVIYPVENNILNTRKIYLWFSEKFFHDCTKHFLHEKVVRYLAHKAQPNANILGAARYNLAIHMEYLQYLLDKNTWLAGEKMSLADIMAATQISTLDFLGEVIWSKVGIVKDWYCVIKSRPSFRDFLKERIIGILTPQHYAQLDF